MNRTTLAAPLASLVLLVATTNAAELDRTVLPSVSPAFGGRIGATWNDSTPDWRAALPPQAPKGAPNVVVIVLDDVGYGQLGAYGGPIDTPNIDRLAASGVRYTNFHASPLCSPTRASLLTGRHAHQVGMASITEAATGYPGNNANMPRSAATIAEVLKHNGYNTFAVGKWHLTPYTSYTAAGPFDRWPLGLGFERFYGFLGGETDQWAPLLVQDNSFIDIPNRPGYHLSADLVDRTIGFVRDQQQANTGRPFFAYVALGAAHAPLHAPKPYIDKYKGRFDAGWDAVRQQTFERQKKLGIIPADTQLPPANPGVAAWSSLSEPQKQVYTRLQEVFAGFLDHADAQIGRLIAALDEMGVRDNTIVMLVSDNGASQEGLRDGAANTDRYRNFNPESVDQMLPLLDKLGGPDTDPHYPMGWAMAGNTPLKRWKQDTHGGGVTVPMILSWPTGIKDRGGLRRQYHHVVDVVPTLYELIGVPAPRIVNGVPQLPLPGTSLAYTFADATSASRKKSQYYEMFGSRAMWADGWTAVSWHNRGQPYERDSWELYHSDRDFSESTDLAAQHPDKLKALQALWQAEAEKYDVLPLDDRRYERVADPTRPVAALPKPVYTFYPGTSVVHPLAAPQVQGREHLITAFVDLPAGEADGVLASFGGEFGGWSLFIKGGRLHYVHNYLKIQEYTVVGEGRLPSGKHRLAMQFIPTGASPRPAFFTGDVKLLVDDQPVGELKDIKVAGQYSSVTGYGLLIGRNTGTAVSHLYSVPFEFRGGLEKVTIEVKPRRPSN